jgi:hypothetical protein
VSHETKEQQEETTRTDGSDRDEDEIDGHVELQRVESLVCVVGVLQCLEDARGDHDERHDQEGKHCELPSSEV